MKTLTRSIRLQQLVALTIGLSLASAARTSNAVIISFSAYATNTSNVMGSADLAGAPGVRVGNWNNFSAFNQDLGDDENVVYDDGSIVTGGFLMAFTVGSGSFSDRSSGHANDVKMYDGVVDTFASSTVALSNIPFDQYDIYFYMRDDGTARAGGFTIGGTTYYVRGGLGNPDNSGNGYVLSTDTAITAGTDSSIDQGNYVRFTGLTGSSQLITLLAAPGSDSVTRNKWGGFQIVQVPEPSTLVMLLGLAGISLLGYIWRRKRS